MSLALIGVPAATAASPKPASSASWLDRACDALEPRDAGAKLLFLLVENALRSKLGAWPRGTRQVAEALAADDVALWNKGRRFEHGRLEAFDAEGGLLHRVELTSARPGDGLFTRWRRQTRIEAADLTAGVDQLLGALGADAAGRVATLRYAHTHPPISLGAEHTFSGLDRRQATLLRDYLARAGLRVARLEMVLLHPGRGGLPTKELRLVPPTPIPWGDPRPLGLERPRR